MAGAAFSSSRKRIPSPSVGRKSGVAHFERPSGPRKGKPRRSTGSSNSARTSCKATSSELATWRTMADLPTPGPPQINVGCCASTTTRNASHTEDAFIEKVLSTGHGSLLHESSLGSEPEEQSFPSLGTAQQN